MKYFVRFHGLRHPRDTGARMDGLGIAIRTGQYLRGYAYRFLEFYSPILTEATVRNAVLPARKPEIE